MSCQICENDVAGWHYHTRSCRACAAFFRRTIKLKLKYSCRRGGRCDIKNANRYSCRHCRMTKCVEMGMTFEEEDLPSVEAFNPQNEDDIPTNTAETFSESPDFYSTENAQRNQKLFMAEFKKRLCGSLNQRIPLPDLPFGFTMCQQVAAAFEKLKAKWPSVSKENLKYGLIDFNLLMLNLCKQLEHIAEFCMSIDAFSEFPQDQRSVLFRRFSLRFHQMERIFLAVDLLGNNVNENKQITLNGEVFEPTSMNFDGSKGSEQFRRNMIKEMSKTAESRINEWFVKPFKRFEADHFERMFLIGINMWTGADDDLTEESRIKCRKMVDCLSEELHLYYVFKRKKEMYAERIYKLFNLVCGMDRVMEMRMEDKSMSTAFDLYTFDEKSN